MLGAWAYIFKKLAIFGSADYITIFSVSFLLKENCWPEFLIYCGAIGWLTYIIKKESKIPYIPAILISTAICILS
jgi:hypothetical protein